MIFSIIKLFDWYHWKFEDAGHDDGRNDDGDDPNWWPTLYSRHVWEKDGSVVNVQSIPRMRLDANGTLHISQTWSGDIGTYTCKVRSVGGNDSHSAHLRVR